MDRINDYSEINVKLQDSKKWTILLVLIFSLILSIFGTLLILYPQNIEGKDLGHLLVPLIVISEIPIFVNYLYLVLIKLSELSNWKSPAISRISKGFTFWYTPGLLFHSIGYTQVVGLVSTHTLLVIDKVAPITVFSLNIPYCVIFLLIFGVIWIFELFLWVKNWPLYPTQSRPLTYLYWIYWFSLFSSSVFVIFHSGYWSQSLFLSIGYIAFVFFTLIGLILQELLKIRVKARESKFKEKLVN
ncbi:MAG: hypothetical protein ACXAC8_05185 [Candidatus Hodarchaeales archaeon]